MASGRTMALTVALALTAAVSGAASQKGLLPAAVDNLNDAQLVEIRDQSGTVLLHGTLKTSSNKPKETEREATLESPTGQKAEGEFEVEIERQNGAVSKEEVELSVEHLPGMTQCELFIDGRHVSSFTTSKSGKGELKLERKAGSGKKG